MELNDLINEQVKEVYAYFGLAMFQSQCVERQLAILLATEYGPGIQKMTRTEYDQRLESLFKKTLGGLITELRKSGAISPNFEVNLSNVLKQRNWLAHNYFWERAGHFMTFKGREMMLEELTKLANELNEFDQELIQISRQWAKKTGIPDSVIQQEMDKLIQEHL